MNKILYLAVILLLAQGCASTGLKRENGNANLNATPRINKSFKGVMDSISGEFLKAYPGSTKHLNGNFLSSNIQPEYWYPHIFVADVSLQEVLNSSCSRIFGRFQESPSMRGRYAQYLRSEHLDYKYYRGIRADYDEEKVKHQYNITYQSLQLNELNKKKTIDIFKYNNSDEFKDAVTNGDKFNYPLSIYLRTSLYAILKSNIRDTKIRDKKVNGSNKINGEFEPLVSYFCFTDVNEFEVIALGQITRKSGLGHSVQFVGYFNQDDFKQGITKATDDYVNEFQKNRMLAEQKVRRKELDKLKQLRKIESDRKKRLEH